ncbi:hypothetical protein EJM73_19440 [Clostridium botulinum]|uniref:hypothetical protein n=1 Tax=Clostridium botulinum TaxID=1491 RepID=UPI0013762302|nr:hypothetical protein [Clostridium botulinum]NCI22174.1 hypothetical protein [Clostridium botulinum]NCI37786.1 hypothetical protein [Clostridium botulinum]NCI74432.1 hypothetical protein [Clostridium botulinum]NDI40907.1 hypothetical protein [Clostridium botulinum]NFA13533.1 hypothetical protein [Clostridium botulinum]
MIYLTMEGKRLRYNFAPFDITHGEKDDKGNLISKEELKTRGVLIEKNKIPTPTPPVGAKAILNLDIPNQKHITQ